MNKRIVFRSILLLVGAIPACGAVCLAQASGAASGAAAHTPSSTAASDSSANNAMSAPAGASTWGPGALFKGTGASAFGTADKSIMKGGASSFGSSKGGGAWTAGAGNFGSSRAEGGVWRSNEGMSAFPAESASTAPSGSESAPRQHAVSAATSTTVAAHFWSSGFASTPAQPSMARSSHGLGGSSLGHAGGLSLGHGGGLSLSHSGGKPGMGGSPMHRTLASARTTSGGRRGRASGIAGRRGARHGTRSFGSSAEGENGESGDQGNGLGLGSSMGLDTGLGQRQLGSSGSDSARGSGRSRSRLSTGLEGSSLGGMSGSGSH